MIKRLLDCFAKTKPFSANSEFNRKLELDKQFLPQMSSWDSLDLSYLNLWKNQAPERNTPSSNHHNSHFQTVGSTSPYHSNPLNRNDTASPYKIPSAPPAESAPESLCDKAERLARMAQLSEQKGEYKEAFDLYISAIQHALTGFQCKPTLRSQN